MSPAADPRTARVHFVITGLDTGGAEMMLLKLVEHSPMLRAGRITTLAPGGELVPRFRDLGMQVDSLDMKPGVPDPRAVLSLATRLRRERPGVVSTWLYHADLVGGLAGRLAGVPVAWNLRSSGLPASSTAASTRLVTRACAVMSRIVPRIIVCCSERARRVHQAMGYPAHKFRLVANGFDLRRYKPDPAARVSVRAELRLADDTPLVGLVARFHPCKNHEGFLEAASEVVRRAPGTHFVLVGDGVDPYNAPLVAAVQRHGLGDNVHLLGLRQDVPRLMASLDVTASTSTTEAFPNVVGEAMACGIPCVVTDAGESASVVGDTGVVAPEGDMAAVAAGLLRLLTLPVSERAALGERARLRAATHFEIGAIAREYERLFQAAAEGDA